MSICYSQPLAVTVAPEEKIDKITIERSMQTVQRHSQPLAVTATSTQYSKTQTYIRKQSNVTVSLLLSLQRQHNT
jgi:hypothetical protein